MALETSLSSSLGEVTSISVLGCKLSFLCLVHLSKLFFRRRRKVTHWDQFLFEFDLISRDCKSRLKIFNDSSGLLLGKHAWNIFKVVIFLKTSVKRCDELLKRFDLHHLVVKECLNAEIGCAHSGCIGGGSQGNVSGDRSDGSGLRLGWGAQLRGVAGYASYFHDDGHACFSTCQVLKLHSDTEGTQCLFAQIGCLDRQRRLSEAKPIARVITEGHKDVSQVTVRILSFELQ